MRMDHLRFELIPGRFFHGGPWLRHVEARGVMYERLRPRKTEGPPDLTPLTRLFDIEDLSLTDARLRVAIPQGVLAVDGLRLSLAPGEGGMRAFGGSGELTFHGKGNPRLRGDHRDQALIQLLDPPFDKSDMNPGYIKGYVPGVRENGGQYTHAAIWMAMAFAKLGDSRRAWELMTMINPVNHGNSPESIATYKVEPYVAAADVYAVQPHTGRGGWTWYTGSAGWMYRLIMESLLGTEAGGG